MGFLLTYISPRNGKTLIVYYQTLSFFACHSKKPKVLFFVFLSTKSLSNLFTSLRYCQVSKETSALRFANLFFGYNFVSFASLDSQFNINLLRFASIFKFFNIN
jgi:hypothetical protein